MSDCICKPFDPAVWDGREFDFAGRHFIKGRVNSFFHVPMNFSAVVARLTKQADAAGARPLDYFALTDETSLWGADHYLEVTRPVAGMAEAAVSGRWLAKVFEGPYSKMGEWIGQMKAELAKRDRKLGRMLFFYAICPKCAKKFGKNQVVMFAEI